MQDNRPKIFISYSWHPEGNKVWVRELAERLTRDGVYVVIDIWDLKSGQDKNLFMEQMVTDESIDKVLIICNKDYAEKANVRRGGVGIESTIISEEIYSKATQTKFIPVVVETDAEGKSYMPTYAKTRIYVDMSNDEKFEPGYDQLLRDIYGKPLSERPPLGVIPAYLEDEEPTYLPTAGLVDGIRKALASGSNQTHILVAKYLERFQSALLQFKIDANMLNIRNFIDEIDKSIDQMQALKNDFLAFLQEIVMTDECTEELFVDFFERLLQFYEDNDIELLHGSDRFSLSVDNYRYFNYDFFLSVITVLIDKERFDIVKALVSYRFCVVAQKSYEAATSQTFMRFRSYVETLNEHKNKRDGGRRVSVTADTVKKYARIVRFEDMVKTDLLLYYLSLIYKDESIFDRYWYPDLSIYNGRAEIYPRLASLRYFNKFKVLFGVNTTEQYKALLIKVQEPELYDGYHRIPKIQFGLSCENVGTMN